ncbi:hypothetical protein [Nostoc sp.]|uniref:hypothetical protein n=1 Tax=Nostoc sp. TaxID=1180 RepID=UPI003FA53A69
MQTSIVSCPDQKRLDLCHTAINEQFNVGNITAVVRSQEHDSFCDLFVHNLFPLFPVYPHPNQSAIAFSLNSRLY